jgi:hypothetical protein
MTYPAEPWALRGQLHASAFLVPLVEIPVDVPPGSTPIKIGRNGIVGVIWVDYQAGGILQYRELMTTLILRRGRALLPTITHIWVDSPQSRDGGRALWGIPKELAVFDFEGNSFAAHDEVGPLARASVRRLLDLPGRWPTNFAVAQWLDGKAKISPVRSRAGLALSKASVEADPTGPLAFLAGRRPFASFSLRDFDMCFGSR